MLLLLFILIPLVGITIGYGVSKAIIIPYLTEQQEDAPGVSSEQTGRENAPNPENPSAHTSEEESQAVNAYQRVYNVEGFELFRIQVGAFSSQENALGLAEELNDRGMAASVDTEGMSKVYTLYSFSGDAAAARLEKVKEHYRDAHVSQIKYPSVDINFSDSSSEEADLLIEQLKECMSMLVDITDEDVSGKNISSIVREQENRIRQFDSQISQTNWPPSMEKYREEASALYAAMLGSYSEYNHQTNIPGQISMELVNCYTGFLERISLII